MTHRNAGSFPTRCPSAPRGTERLNARHGWTLLIVAWIVFCAPSIAPAQMARTGEADAATETWKPAMDIVFCKDAEKDNYRFTVYDRRVLPAHRVLPSFTLMGKEQKKAKLKRKNKACAGGEGTLIGTSNALAVEPIFDAQSARHFWMVALNLTNGGQLRPLPLFQDRAPVIMTILYHPEVRSYCIQDWEAGCTPGDSKDD